MSGVFSGHRPLLQPNQDAAPRLLPHCPFFAGFARRQDNRCLGLSHPVNSNINDLSFLSPERMAMHGPHQFDCRGDTTSRLNAERNDSVARPAKVVATPRRQRVSVTPTLRFLALGLVRAAGSGDEGVAVISKRRGDASTRSPIESFRLRSVPATISVGGLKQVKGAGLRNQRLETVEFKRKRGCPVCTGQPLWINWRSRSLTGRGARRADPHRRECSRAALRSRRWHWPRGLNSQLISFAR